ncbi:TNF receptor-associated factor 5-like [Ornithodoros turicata]|uniref:TNF receptor-associated factor 5-like n=1 Tax=Ornithodoros turicata TaxID=34597 RepID=UPI003138E8E6
MFNVGICSLCNTKCVSVWVTNPCNHEVCSKCLAHRGNLKTCFQCSEGVEFLKCPGSQNGCTFNTGQGSWDAHKTNCFHLPVECPYECQTVVAKKRLVTHMTTECKLRHALCRYCHDTVFHIELADHEETCLEAPMRCPFCFEGNIKRGLLQLHAKSCEKTPKPCPLNEYGCSFLGLDRVMEGHLTVKNHVPCFQKLKDDVEKRDAEIASLRDCVDAMKNVMMELARHGAVFFDKELKFALRAPKERSVSAFECPVYRHISTDASFTFTLDTTRTGRVYLRQHLLSAGNSVKGKTFTAIVEDTDDRKLAKKTGIVCCNQNVLDWYAESGRFQIVTFAEEG